MAEGGYHIPGENENPWEDWGIDHDDDDDEEEVDTTTPFQPGAASTPYHGGEKHEMATLPREQSGFDPEDIPLLEGDFLDATEKAGLVDQAMDWLKKRFPRVDISRLDPIGFGRKRGNEGKIVSFGARGGETPVFKKDGSGLLKPFTDKFKGALGPSAEEIVSESDTAIREESQRLKEAEKQLKKDKRIAAEKQQAAERVQNLRSSIEQTQARREALEQDGGSRLENETEINRLKQLEKKSSTRS